MSCSPARRVRRNALQQSRQQQMDIERQRRDAEHSLFNDTFLPLLRQYQDNPNQTLAEVEHDYGCFFTTQFQEQLQQFSVDRAFRRALARTLGHENWGSLNFSIPEFDDVG